jgi:hypothetical protein
MRASDLVISVLCLVLLSGLTVLANEPAARISQSQRFADLAQQPTGLLIPLYIYPANIHTHAAFNRLIDLKQEHPRVPVWAIVNPGSGPGTQVDANYTKAVDRLHGAGIVLLGYVSTEYGKRSAADVERDLDTWRRLYPKVHGAFFDEMLNADTAAAVEQQVQLRRLATDRGFWPTVANPGTATPERYFAQEAADVFVIHEGADYPTAASLKGDYFGGYADYPPWTRCVMVHSRPTFEPQEFARIKKHARWVYVTDDVFRDMKQDNPWDSLPTYLERLFSELER